jgi:acetyltransferase-like isoleucine patch superfamily enzyme
MYEALRVDMRERWNRDLPLEELLFDRWQRAESLGFGEGSSIYHSSYVYGNVRVGRHTWIGPLALLDGSGGLTIGDHCAVGAGVQIYTHDTVARVLSEGRLDIDQAPVEIGNYCHISPLAFIGKGVTIGDYSVIGAHSFVNRSIPSHTVAMGVPCRPIGRVVIDDQGSPQLIYDDR